MDPLFVARQPAPPPGPSPLWQTITTSSMSAGVLQHSDVEYHFATATAPPHTFSSPPSTPLTPIPHPLVQHGTAGFPHHVDLATVQQRSSNGSLLYYNTPGDIPQPPPALSHSDWPPEYRLYSLCQELQQYPGNDLLNEEASKAWWDGFLLEYFHNMATLVIEIDFGEGMKQYVVSRDYIPWYFKSILHETGLSSYTLLLGNKTVHTFQQQLQRILCSNAVQELDYVSPHQTKVCCQGQLLVDFTIEDKPRVLHWMFQAVNHVEFIPRFCLHASSNGDTSMSTNITCKGLPAATQALLMQLNQPGNSAPPIGPVSRDNCHTQLMSYPQPQRVTGNHGDDVIIRTCGYDPSTWDQHTSAPPNGVHTPQDGQQGNILSHPPLPIHHMSHSPPTLPASQSSSTAHSTSPPLTSPVLNGIHSNGSTCSISSSCNGTRPSSVPVPQSKPTKGLVTSPTKLPYKFMIAMEPAYFSDDMVHGDDERVITRIENCNRQATPTPSTTPSDSDSVTTPTQQLPSSKGVTLSWLESCSSWSHAPR